jgi:hypothetical protein
MLTMRNFQTLDRITVDPETGIMTLAGSTDTPHQPTIAMRREGAYIAISAGYGPMEIALRPRIEDLARLLGRLQPVDGLQTTRQVGTSQAYLAIGLRRDGTLVIRPTIAADATGHFTINLTLTPHIRQAFFEWLPVERHDE